MVQTTHQSTRVHKLVVIVYEDLGLEDEDLVELTRGSVCYYDGQRFTVDVRSPDGTDFTWEGVTGGTTT